jgi:diguanylate cyclase (GGDEF)-like protein
MEAGVDRMTPTAVILAVLFCTNSVLSLTMGLAWRDLGKPRHALIWSMAFGAASLQWILNATGMQLFPQALPYLATVSALSMTSGALWAIGCRQRAGLPPYYFRFSMGVVVFTSIAVTTSALGLGPFSSTSLFGCVMFMSAVSAMLAKGRRTTHGERVLICAMALFAVFELLLVMLSVAQIASSTPELMNVYRLILGLGLTCGYIVIGVAAVFLIATDLAVQMRVLTISDPLTGVYNRRGFEQAAAQAIVATRLRGEPLAVIIADLDGFKTINDRHGHAVGDDVLQRFATHVATSLRRGDMVGRLGGEEFGILLANTTGEAAVGIVDRIRSEFAMLSIGDDAPVQVTCSFGIAELADDDRDIGTAVNRADQALYRAKSAGRNRVALNDTVRIPTPNRRGVGLTPHEAVVLGL